MKLAIVTVGSRGDVQPYVAFALGLKSAGHDVRVVTDAAFEGFVRNYGLEFFPLHANPEKALRDYVDRLGTNPLLVMNFLKRHFEDTARQSYIDVLEACRDVDAIIASNLAIWAYDVAEARGIPCLASSLQPVHPTRSFRSSSFPRWPAWLPFEETYNWSSFRWSTRLFFRLTREMTEKYRREILDLPPRPWSYYASIDVAEIPMLYGYSRHVVPKPTDWGDWLQVTGYWFLEPGDGWEPSADLVEFLENGPPPVYFGLGSMIDRDARAVTDTVVRALERTGRRGILFSGWSDLGRSEMPDNVFRIDDVPHDWLFPRMAAVVHHGGAGTTHTGLRAGVPTIVIPFFGDQFFWGDRVFDLGAGPRPIPRPKLSTRNLAEAILAATEDSRILARVTGLGRKIHAESGVTRAVEAFEAILSRQLVANAGRKKLTTSSSQGPVSVRSSSRQSLTLATDRGPNDDRDKFDKGGFTL